MEFEPWKTLGWNLWIRFYHDVDFFGCQLWISNFQDEAFARLGILRRPEEFEQALALITDEAARKGMKVPDYRPILSSMKGGWLKVAFQEAHRRFPSP